MSSKKKRVDEEMEVVGDDFEEDVNDDDDEEDEDYMGTQQNEEVQVEFEARMPEDSDFHGIRTLLQQLFLKANVDISEVANTIISQNYIGSVVKQSYIPEDDSDDDDMVDEDPVFGLTSVLNITDRKDLNCVGHIKTMLIEKCKCVAPEISQKFSQLINSPDYQLGLLLNERFINIPPQFKEMEKAKRKKMKYDFSHYLMICKTYRCKLMGGKQQKGGDAGEGQVFYTNPEEELIKEVSDFNFTYSVQSERDSIVDGKWNAEDQMEALRTVLIIPADKLPLAIQKIKSELGAT
ncbi:hypothetical protein KUTeg_005339 [Tegillarca granosa]|uniref:Protein BCCIP homolog n=1 Tax=Tegillarca granosa TaxID=220873 RepID=A0ABQ9FJG9_TEGGR|nr:hypothetical protein KUTeg_005339 [Tegillarca granosa]